MNCPDPTEEATELASISERRLAVGCLETSSIARGIEAADAMLKAAEVRLLACNPVCPGKYIVLIGGLVAEVTSSVRAGEAAAADTLTDAIVIPNVHPQVLDAFSAMTRFERVEAIGLIETFSLPSAVLAGDQAVKSARVDLLEIRLARALGGKAYVLLTGEVAAVRAALEAGAQAGGQNGLLLGTTLIPAPHPDLIPKLL
ncbi:MAG: BMC domain-containing protein [Deltaproteobacteria bacterium]|nr:BMC domain-containing protein [Deltaproteobacteria bacterium]